jgi:hypothetical protein
MVHGSVDTPLTKNSTDGIFAVKVAAVGFNHKLSAAKCEMSIK